MQSTQSCISPFWTSTSNGADGVIDVCLGGRVRLSGRSLDGDGTGERRAAQAGLRVKGVLQPGDVGDLVVVVGGRVCAGFGISGGPEPLDGDVGSVDGDCAVRGA